jgi:Zn-dependent protease
VDIGYWIQLLSLYAIPAVLAITLHEAAHGYAAKRLGDLTAYQEGRITLNPIKHIDLIGTLVVPAVLLLATGGKIAFGRGGWSRCKLGNGYWLGVTLQASPDRARKLLQLSFA